MQENQQALQRATDLLPAAAAGGLELEDFMDALDLAECLGQWLTQHGPRQQSQVP